MRNMVVTIGRQYGSGGKTIGEMLAKDLGVPFYGREIIMMASEDSGISEQLFGRVDEQLDVSLLKKLTRNVYSGKLISPENRGFVSDDNLFNYQAKIIRGLAEQESCVIIGRCAGFILRDYPNVARVFVHADEQFLLEQAMERNSMTTKEMKRYIEKVNKHRSEYYKYYAGNDWYDAKNYDLCIDSTNLGFEKSVGVIKEYLRIRFNY